MSITRANIEFSLPCLSSNLVKCFITKELVRWPSIEGIYGPTLRQTRVFLSGDEDGDRRWEDLHTRVIEHVRSFPVFVLPLVPSANVYSSPRTSASLHYTITASH